MREKRVRLKYGETVFFICVCEGGGRSKVRIMRRAFLRLQCRELRVGKRGWKVRGANGEKKKRAGGAQFG